MEQDYARAFAEGVIVKAIVVINPNNPTGSIFTLEQMEGIIRFAYKNKILIIADEVYEYNVYLGYKFTSFRKVALNIERPYNRVSLVSLNSISKGFTGECGLRGGYMDFYNFDPEVMGQIHKIRDACSVNVTGSIALAVLCDPPTIENASRETAERFTKEKEGILSFLEHKAKRAMHVFNECKGVKCSPIAGSLYAFPQIFLPRVVVKRAKENGLEPCEYFCKALLEETGIVTVPGCGFGQKPDTYHFRMSLLIWDLDEFDKVLEIMKDFINKYFDLHS